MKISKMQGAFCVLANKLRKALVLLLIDVTIQNHLKLQKSGTSLQLIPCTSRYKTQQWKKTKKGKPVIFTENRGGKPLPAIAIKYVELKFGNQWNGINRYYLFKKEQTANGKSRLPVQYTITKKVK